MNVHLENAKLIIKWWQKTFYLGEKKNENKNNLKILHLKRNLKIQIIVKNIFN